MMRAQWHETFHVGACADALSARFIATEQSTTQEGLALIPQSGNIG
jgi:hypothetical protein